MFKVAIPLFDAGKPDHVRVVAAAEQAEQVAAGVDVAGVRFQQARARVRAALEETGVADELERTVAAVIPHC